MPDYVQRYYSTSTGQFELCRGFPDHACDKGIGGLVFRERMAMDGRS